MDLSIIIVSWNVKKLLEKCLTTLYTHTRGVTFEIFVIDNASTDGTPSMVAEKFPRVHCITNATNKGFAAANNQGIKAAQSTYLLLLNPDTECIENSGLKMVEFMNSHSDVGVAGCHLQNPDGSHQPSVRRFPQLADQLCILSKIHHLFPRIKPVTEYLLTSFDYTKTHTIDQVMGAFFMIRSSVIKEIGYLDENFFNWFEEVDFCKRVASSQWKVAYTPVTNVIHYAGQSFKQVMPLSKQKVWNASVRYYFFKHHSFFAYCSISFASFLSIIQLPLYQLFNFVYTSKNNPRS